MEHDAATFERGRRGGGKGGVRRETESTPNLCRGEAWLSPGHDPWHLDLSVGHIDKRDVPAPEGYAWDTMELGGRLPRNGGDALEKRT